MAPKPPQKTATTRPPALPSSAKAAPKPPGEPAAPTPPTGPGRFFTKEDWFAAAATFLIAGLTYWYYVSPEVTLEDSGELVTGAFNFGVPHPPGYPLWAFLGWVWCHVLPFGNPAHRLGLMSALTGALLVGSMTLLMTRSILMLLRSSVWADDIEEPLKHWIALTVGSCVSLMLAFNRGVWLWACVPEMRVLSVFLFVITTCLFFAWMMRPDRYPFLYATVLLFGLGTTNHQTIMIMAAPFLVGALLVSPVAFCELLVAAMFSAATGFVVIAWLKTATVYEFFNLDWWWAAVWTASAAVAALVLVGNQGWLNRRRALAFTGLFLLGCSFYLYMPLASSTNPPMNWGYTATKAGFLHHISREQYQRLEFSTFFSREFFLQVALLARTLFHQYTLPLSLFSLLTLGFWQWLGRRARAWVIFLWVAFLFTSVGLILIINPGLEKQQQEINLKFFAPAHAFFAMLIGYGLALACNVALVYWKSPSALALWRGQGSGAGAAPEPPGARQLSRIVVRVACVALLVLPFVFPFRRNFAICEQRHHDFGYQFGYRMFNPGGGYPPMDRGAVLYGGTDPGRFVPTYMIFCESRVKPQDRFRDQNFDRSDVIIITQNALADNTYMSYVRDHYGLTRPANDSFFQRLLGRDHTYPPDPIWIPAERDNQAAFQQYLTEWQSRPHGPGENVRVENGKVSVTGVEAVMAINAILTRMIFDHAKQQHTFYVEESYPIMWMYNYLEPYGIIMKLNQDPLPSPEEDRARWDKIIDRDTNYWNTLIAEFKDRPEFKRDADAQKTFSKLRSAIGGVYVARHLPRQAEYAFQQALELSEESPEANFRLTQLYMDEGRYSNAVAVLTKLLDKDPLNGKIGLALQQVQGVKAAADAIPALEQTQHSDPTNIQHVIRLAQAYARASRPERIQPLLEEFLANPAASADDLLQIAQAYLGLGLLDRSLITLQTISARYPKDSRPYYILALIRSAQAETNDAIDALIKAIQLNPEIRGQARADQRFGNLARDPRFRQIIGSAPLP